MLRTNPSSHLGHLNSQTGSRCLNSCCDFSTVPNALSFEILSLYVNLEIGHYFAATTYILGILLAPLHF